MVLILPYLLFTRMSGVVIVACRPMPESHLAAAADTFGIANEYIDFI